MFKVSLSSSEGRIFEKFIIPPDELHIPFSLHEKLPAERATTTLSSAAFAMIKWKSISVEDINFIFFFPLLYHILTHNPNMKRAEEHTLTSYSSGPYISHSPPAVDVMRKGTSKKR